MIEIIFVLVAVLFVFTYRATQAQSPFRKLEYSMLTMFMAILLVSGGIAYYTSNPSGQSVTISNTVYTSNQIYQNTNYTSLTIYSQTSSNMKAWEGAHANNMTQVQSMNMSVLATGSTTTYNLTATLQVPLDWYFKFNYTGGQNHFETLYFSD